MGISILSTLPFCHSQYKPFSTALDFSINARVIQCLKAFQPLQLHYRNANKHKNRQSIPHTHQMQLCGGYSQRDSKEIPDKVKELIEEKHKSKIVEVLEYNTQVVAGINHKIKAKFEDGSEHQDVVWQKLDKTFKINE